MTVKHLLFLLLISTSAYSSAQTKTLNYDSIVVDYSDYLNNVYYKYVFSDGNVGIKGEAFSHKRIADDSTRWRFSYYTDVSREDFSVLFDTVEYDSIQKLFEDLCSLVFASNGQYVDAIVEGDNLIVELTGYNQSEKQTLRMVLCSDCFHVIIVDKFLDYLKTIKDKLAAESKQQENR